MPASEEDDDSMQVVGERQDQAIKQVRAALNEMHNEFSIFDARRTSNGLIVVYAHGRRNHRYEPLIKLFKWIAGSLFFNLCFGFQIVANRRARSTLTLARYSQLDEEKVRVRIACD